MSYKVHHKTFLNVAQFIILHLHPIECKLYTVYRIDSKLLKTPTYTPVTPPFFLLRWLRECETALASLMVRGGNLGYGVATLSLCLQSTPYSHQEARSNSCSAREQQ